MANSYEELEYLRQMLQRKKESSKYDSFVNPNDNDYQFGDDEISQMAKFETDNETFDYNVPDFSKYIQPKTTGDKRADEAINGWKRAVDSVGSLNYNIIQGFFNFFDSIGDSVLNAIDFLGGGDVEWAQKARDYDWVTQANIVSNFPIGLFSGDVFTGKYWEALGDEKKAQEYFDEIVNKSNLLSEKEGINNFMSGVEQSIGFMLPSIVAGVGAGGASEAAGASASVVKSAAKKAALGTMFAGASTNAANEVYKETGDYGKALVVGALKGGIEVGTEMIFPESGVLGIVGGKEVTVGIKEFAKAMGHEFFEEGIEEVISALAEPFVDEIYKDGSLKESYGNLPKFLFGIGGDFNESVFGQGLSGGVTGVLMGGSAQIQTNAYIKSLVGKEGTKLIAKGQELGEVLDKYYKDAKKTKVENGKKVSMFTKAELEEKYGDELGKIGAEWLKQWSKVKDKLTPEQKKNFAKLIENPAQVLKESDLLNNETLEDFTKRTIENSGDLSKAISLAKTAKINDLLKSKLQLDFISEELIENRVELEKHLGFNLSDEEYEILRTGGEAFAKGNTIVLNEKYKNDFNRLIAHEAISHGILDSNVELRNNLLNALSNNEEFFNAWQKYFNEQKNNAGSIAKLYKLEALNVRNITKKQFSKAVSTLNSEQMASFVEFIVSNENLFNTLSNVSKGNLRTILRRALDSVKGVKNDSFTKAKHLLENTLKAIQNNNKSNNANKQQVAFSVNSNKIPESVSSFKRNQLYNEKLSEFQNSFYNNYKTFDLDNSFIDQVTKYKNDYKNIKQYVTFGENLDILSEVDGIKFLDNTLPVVMKGKKFFDVMQKSKAKELVTGIESDHKHNISPQVIKNVLEKMKKPQAILRHTDNRNKTRWLFITDEMLNGQPITVAISETSINSRQDSTKHKVLKIHTISPRIMTLKNEKGKVFLKANRGEIVYVTPTYKKGNSSVQKGLEGLPYDLIINEKGLVVNDGVKRISEIKQKEIKMQFEKINENYKQKAINDNEYFKQLSELFSEAQRYGLNSKGEIIRKQISNSDISYSLSNVPDSFIGRDDLKFSISDGKTKIEGKTELHKFGKMLYASHSLGIHDFERMIRNFKTGIPVPSIAIHTNKKTMSNFGNISFIFSKDTINQPNTDIFLEDAYTPTLSGFRGETEQEALEYLKKQKKQSGGYNYDGVRMASDIEDIKKFNNFMQKRQEFLSKFPIELQQILSQLAEDAFGNATITKKVIEDFVNENYDKGIPIIDYENRDDAIDNFFDNLIQVDIDNQPDDAIDNFYSYEFREEVEESAYFVDSLLSNNIDYSDIPWTFMPVEEAFSHSEITRNILKTLKQIELKDRTSISQKINKDIYDFIKKEVTKTAYKSYFDEEKINKFVHKLNDYFNSTNEIDADVIFESLLEANKHFVSVRYLPKALLRLACEFYTLNTIHTIEDIFENTMAANTVEINKFGVSKEDIIDYLYYQPNSPHTLDAIENDGYDEARYFGEAKPYRIVDYNEIKAILLSDMNKVKQDLFDFAKRYNIPVFIESPDHLDEEGVHWIDEDSLDKLLYYQKKYGAIEIPAEDNKWEYINNELNNELKFSLGNNKADTIRESKYYANSYQARKITYTNAQEIFSNLVNFLNKQLNVKINNNIFDNIAKELTIDFNTLNSSDAGALKLQMEKMSMKILDTNLKGTVIAKDGEKEIKIDTDITLRSAIEATGVNSEWFENYLGEEIPKLFEGKSKISKIQDVVNKYQERLSEAFIEIANRKKITYFTVKSQKNIVSLKSKFEGHTLSGTNRNISEIPLLAYYKQLVNNVFKNSIVTKSKLGISPTFVNNLVNALQSYNAEALMNTYDFELELDNENNSLIEQYRDYLIDSRSIKADPNMALDYKEMEITYQLIGALNKELSNLINAEKESRRTAVRQADLELRTLEDAYRDGSRWDDSFIQTELNKTSSPDVVLKNYFGSNSSAYKLLFENIFDAESNQKLKQIQFQNRYNEIKEKYGIKDKDLRRKVKVTFDKRTFEIPTNVLLDIYTMTLTEATYNTIINGGYDYNDGKKTKFKIVLTPNDIVKFDTYLDDNLRKFAEEVLLDLYNGEMRDYKSQRDIQIKGYEVLLFNDMFYPSNKADSSSSSLEQTNYGVINIENTSINKERKKAYHLALIGMGFEDRFMSYNNALTKYGEMSDSIKLLNTFLNGYTKDSQYDKPKKRRRMFKDVTNALGNIFDFYYERLGGKNDYIRSGSKFFSNIVQATLYGTPSVVLKQTASLPTILNVVHTKSFFKAFKDIPKNIKEYKKIKAELMEKSGFLADRWTNLDVVKAEALTQYLNKVSKIFGVPMEKMDEAVIVAFGYGAAIEESKITGEDPIKILERIVANTQSNAIDIKMSEARTGAAGYIRKILSYFTSDLQNKISLLNNLINEKRIAKKTIKSVDAFIERTEAELKDLREEKSLYTTQEEMNTKEYKALIENIEEKEGKLKTLEEIKKQKEEIINSNNVVKGVKLATSSVLSALIIASIGELIKRLLGKRDWKWNEEDTKNFGITLLLESTINNLPYVSTLLNSIEYGEKISGLDLSVLNQFITIFNDLYKNIQGEGDWVTTLKDVCLTLGNMTGLPIGNLYKYSVGLYKNISPNGYKVDAIVNSYSPNYLYKEYKSAIDLGMKNKANGYLELMLSQRAESSETVRDEINALYKDGYNAIPSPYITSYTNEKGETVSLTEEQINAFKTEYNKSNAQIEKLMQLTDYHSKTGEERAKLIKKIYDTYYNYAKAKVLKQKTANNKLSTLLLLSNGRIGIARFVNILSKISSITDTKRKTRKQLVFEYVNRLGFSKNEKLLLLYLAGYKSKENNAKISSYLRSLGLSKDKIETFLG